jgi:predicted GNAT family acetyltransferase
VNKPRASRVSHPEPEGVEIVDVPEASRYEARIGSELAGWVDYRRMRNRIVAIHTEVPAAFGGRGIGSALVRRVLADARSAGNTVSPLCPLFVAHFERHPEDRDILGPVPRSQALRS